VTTDATGLVTDLYQLTMAQGYWRSGLSERRAVFHLTYRRPPFGGRAAIACGLATAIEALERWRFPDEDRDYLATLRGADGRPLFQDDFLAMLGERRFTGEVRAIPEGTTVLPRTPLLRVDAPLLEGQIVETMLLTIVNFQTLIATKAARIRQAAGSGEVLEFGLRRAQGLDGGFTASRAAFVGGGNATSNVAAGRAFDIPVRGTHAHSWVMAFETELEAFRRYAQALPNNVVLLVDTYDTRGGLERAVRVAKELHADGGRFLGVRLDSGDPAELSREARRMLDEAGLIEAKIVVSGDLDEHSILALRRGGAPIDVWGVGTRLVTAHDHPALGGVYKLGAIADERGRLLPRLKLSDDPIKISDPGALSTVRIRRDGAWIADVLRGDRQDDERPVAPLLPETVDPKDLEPRIELGDRKGLEFEGLETVVMRDGIRTGELPSARQARERTLRSLAEFDLLAGAGTSGPRVVSTGSLARERGRLARSHRGETA